MGLRTSNERTRRRSGTEQTGPARIQRSGTDRGGEGRWLQARDTHSILVRQSSFQAHTSWCSLCDGIRNFDGDGGGLDFRWSWQDVVRQGRSAVRKSLDDLVVVVMGADASRSTSMAPRVLSDAKLASELCKSSSWVLLEVVSACESPEPMPK